MAARFEDHSEQMKKFHEIHPAIGLAAPRRQFATLNSLWSLYTGTHISASGGAFVPVNAMEWLVLTPMWQMTGQRFLWN